MWLYMESFKIKWEEQPTKLMPRYTSKTDARILRSLDSWPLRFVRVQWTGSWGCCDFIRWKSNLNSLQKQGVSWDFYLNILNKTIVFTRKTPKKMHKNNTSPKTNGRIPKMMGLGKGDSFQIWPFLVSMLNSWPWGMACRRRWRHNRCLGVWPLKNDTWTLEGYFPFGMVIFSAAVLNFRWVHPRSRKKRDHRTQSIFYAEEASKSLIVVYFRSMFKCFWGYCRNS